MQTHLHSVLRDDSLQHLPPVPLWHALALLALHSALRLKAAIRVQALPGDQNKALPTCWAPVLCARPPDGAWEAECMRAAAQLSNLADSLQAHAALHSSSCL
jgi:hypothetical protein